MCLSSVWKTHPLKDLVGSSIPGAPQVARILYLCAHSDGTSAYKMMILKQLLTHAYTELVLQ